MLYLINGSDLDNNGNPIKLLKIGFTKNLNQREKSYKSMGNFSGFIETRNGDKNLESAFHLYFRKYKYEKLNEWFYYNDEIINKFPQLTEDEIYKSLWYIIEEVQIIKSKYTNLILEVAKYNRNKLDPSNNIHKSIISCLIKSEEVDTTPLQKEIIVKEESPIEEIKLPINLSNTLCLPFTPDENKIIESFYKTIKKLNFNEKMIKICEFLDKCPNYKELLYNFVNKKDKILILYWDFYGTSGCKIRKYDEFNLSEDYNSYGRKLQTYNNFLKIFDQEKSYTFKEIQQLILNNRKKLNILTRTPNITQGELSYYGKLIQTKQPEEKTKYKFIPKIPKKPKYTRT